MHHYLSRCGLIFATLLLSSLSALQGAELETAEQASSAQANVVQAELIWTDFDGQQHLLLHAQYQSEQWSEPKAIYVSNNAITTPTLATLSSAALTADLAIWTEQRKGKTVLMQARRIEREAWQPAIPFYALGQDNFSPTVITDLADTSYVFWSHTEADNHSDIVYSFKHDAATDIASDWSAPQRLHPSNTVPDLAPKAILKPNGEIMITWQTFNASALAYVASTAVLAGTSERTDLLHLADTDPDYVDPVALRKLVLPGFVPENRSFTLFSALNKLERAIVLP